MILLGLIATLSYLPGWTGAYIPTMWAGLSIALAFTLWLRVPSSPLHWLGLGFLLYAFASIFWTINLWTGVWQLWNLMILALAFRLGSRQESLVPLYKGLAIGLGINSAIAVVQWFGWVPFLSAGNSTSGLLWNPMALAEACALVIVALASEGLWLWTLPLLPGLYLAHSRGAWLMLAIVALIALSRRVWVGLATLAAGGLWLWLHPSTSDTIRLFTWRVALEGFDFFGNGAGSFLSILVTRPDGVTFHLEHTHNDYLDLIYQYGIGVVPLFALFTLLAFRARHSPPWYPFIGTLIMALYSFPLFAPVTAFTFALCAGNLIHRDARVWANGLGWRLRLLPWGYRPRGETLSIQLGSSLHRAASSEVWAA